MLRRRKNRRAERRGGKGLGVILGERYDPLRPTQLDDLACVCLNNRR
jgi:hypothetical protein